MAAQIQPSQWEAQRTGGRSLTPEAHEIGRCRSSIWDSVFRLWTRGGAGLRLWTARSVLGEARRGAKKQTIESRTTEYSDRPDWDGAVRKMAIGVPPKKAREARVFKRILKILPAVCLATCMAWAAESPFIGDWKLDPSKTRMPDEMKVESKGGNKYAFDFGGGVETIVVDGSDQPGGLRRDPAVGEG